jgi:hypothetical protein
VAALEATYSEEEAVIMTLVMIVVSIKSENCQVGIGSFDALSTLNLSGFPDWI